MKITGGELVETKAKSGCVFNITSPFEIPPPEGDDEAAERAEAYVSFVEANCPGCYYETPGSCQLRINLRNALATGGEWSSSLNVTRNKCGARVQGKKKAATAIERAQVRKANLNAKKSGAGG